MGGLAFALTWLHGKPMVTSPSGPYFSCRAWMSLYCGVFPADQNQLKVCRKNASTTPRPTALGRDVDE